MVNKGWNSGMLMFVPRIFYKCIWSHETKDDWRIYTGSLSIYNREFKIQIKTHIVIKLVGSYLHCHVRTVCKAKQFNAFFKLSSNQFNDSTNEMKSSWPFAHNGYKKGEQIEQEETGCAKSHMPPHHNALIRILEYSYPGGPKYSLLDTLMFTANGKL
jgi:hypothetical protein